MNGAVPLGRIAVGLVRKRPERKAQFMAVMQEAFSDFVEEATGTRPTWPNPPQSAPEHERSGHA